MLDVATASMIAAAVIWHLLASRATAKLGLIRPNFSGKLIPASYGIAAFGYVVAGVIVFAQCGLVKWPVARLYVWMMGAMWALGALDDIFGSREVGGFAGHFRKLIFERKLTTGAIKALGGGIVGIAAGWAVSGGKPWLWAGTAVIIPLTANLLNLFDLRPGRALAVFFVGLGVTYVVVLGKMQAPWITGTIVAVALAFGIADSRGKAMMGDSWSNALGAALGLTMALDAPILIGPAIVVFVAIHLYSEKHSISALIERNPVLRSIDRRLGVR